MPNPGPFDIPHQIPWATDTKVTGEVLFQSPRRGIAAIYLSSPYAKATVYPDGSFDIEYDSNKNISDYMDKSDKLTRSLRRYYKLYKGNFLDATRAWLKGEPIPEFELEKPVLYERPGVLDWMPPIRKREPRAFPKIGKTGYFKSGSSENLTDYWVGSDFEYFHFETPEGEEGLAILWPGDPYSIEVWMGDTDQFFSANQEDLSEPDTMSHINKMFENGLLWAWDRMNVFTGGWSPEEAVDLVRDNPSLLAPKISEDAIEMILRDPDLLWPDLVEKLHPLLAALPIKLEEAVLTWIDRRTAQAEKEGGQLRFWPRHGE